MLNTEITEPRFQVCVVMLTHNRKERCLDCIRHTAAALQGVSCEILVINNGSDHIPLPEIINGVPCRLINLGRNIGVRARNIAMRKTDSEFLLMLDDDAYIEEEVRSQESGVRSRNSATDNGQRTPPLAGQATDLSRQRRDNGQGLVQAMIRIFQSDPKIGAVAFSIYHNDHAESCLLPTVFHGCACGFRSSALKEIGGYPTDFLYYGEEYSVAFRLYQAGYRIVMSEELKRVHHARDSRGRNINRIMQLLTRNNTSLWVSSFPWQAIPSAVFDTLRRYFLVARKEKALCGFIQGCAELPWSIFRGLYKRAPLSREIFRKITLIDQVETICNEMQIANCKLQIEHEVIICGVGKFPSFWLKILAEHGISVRAFWDTNSCWKGQTIHGVPVLVRPEMYRGIGVSECRSHEKKTHSVTPTPFTVTTDNGQRTTDFSADTPIRFLVGTSSISETHYWKKYLEEHGLLPITLQQESATHHLEKFSPSGTFDLLETNLLELYSEP